MFTILSSPPAQYRNSLVSFPRMGSIKLLLLNLFRYSLALFYGTFVFIRILIVSLINPVRAFRRVDRLVPPKVLEDPSLGQHQYISLKSRGVKLHYVAHGSPDSPLMLFVHGFPEVVSFCLYA